jgi:hypothetical protein
MQGLGTAEQRRSHGGAFAVVSDVLGQVAVGIAFDECLVVSREGRQHLVGITRSSLVAWRMVLARS